MRFRAPAPDAEAAQAQAGEGAVEEVDLGPGEELRWPALAGGERDGEIAAREDP